jgi:hypothetical protein
MKKLNKKSEKINNYFEKSKIPIASLNILL